MNHESAKRLGYETEMRFGPAIGRIETDDVEAARAYHEGRMEARQEKRLRYLSGQPADAFDNKRLIHFYN